MGDYNKDWLGADRGHEGLWEPSVLTCVLKCLADNGGTAVISETSSSFYSALSAAHPDIGWVSDDHGNQRSFLRDAREPWVFTNTLSFGNTTVSLTETGKSLVKGHLQFGDVVLDGCSKYREPASDENPFAILAFSLLECNSGTWLSLSDAAKIMRHFRPKTEDNLLTVIGGDEVAISNISARRLKHILTLLQYSGIILKVKDKFTLTGAELARRLVNSSYGNANASPLAKDILTVALKCFSCGRDKASADIWSSFDEWAKDARQTFSVVDEHQIVDPSFDYNHFVRFVFSSRQRTAFSKFDAAQKAAVGKFLREERSSPHSISWYIDPANKVPVEGIGTGVMLYFMMMVKPEEFATWSGKMDEGLSILGLRADATPEPLTVASYEKSKSLQQVVLQKMHEMDIGKAADDPTPADYLTVNEFLWFVTANEKDIKNEVQKMKLTDPKPTAKNPGKKTWATVLSEKPDEMMNRLIAALLTKPFAILTGASGTGKSRMVRKLAYMTCLNTQLQPDPSKKKPIENFRMVQIKPNWHDSSELLGYKSAVSATSKYVSTDFVRFILKAHAFPETPFFVCLDEMNLAPVEHYFAEFLSASESARFEDGEWITDAIIDPGEFGGDINNLDPTDYSIPSPRKELIEKIGLFIPHNLFVVGTVNMDDSTSGFSRKVLDRAMTLEMDEVNYEDLQKPSNLALFDETDSTGKVIANGLLLGANEVAAFISRCQFGPEKLDNGFRDKLTKVKDKLHGTPLAVAHRFARESVQYREALQTLFAGKGIADFDEYAIDHMMLMKVLPRLEGNKDELGDLLGKLKDIFGSLSGHKISADKFDKMEIAAGMNGGYFSFYL